MEIEQDIARGPALRGEPFSAYRHVDALNRDMPGVQEAQKVGKTEHAARASYHRRWIALLPALDHELHQARGDSPAPARLFRRADLQFAKGSSAFGHATLA